MRLITTCVVVFMGLSGSGFAGKGLKRGIPSVSIFQKGNGTAEDPFEDVFEAEMVQPEKKRLDVWPKIKNWAY